METILGFMGEKEATQSQNLNKEFYKKITQRAIIKIEMPKINLVLERNRNQIYIGYWHEDTRDLEAVSILKIGENEAEGEISPSRLGFNEVYFQYFIDLGNFTFAVFAI